MPCIEPTPRITFCMITIMILWGIGSYVMVFDYASVSTKGSEQWLRDNPDWFIGKKEMPQPERFWEWDIGNHFVSNIENIVMMLTLFFGFMRFIDLMKLFHEAEKEQAWRMFFELCEDVENEEKIRG